MWQQFDCFWVAAFLSNLVLGDFHPAVRSPLSYNSDRSGCVRLSHTSTVTHSKKSAVLGLLPMDSCGITGIQTCDLRRIGQTFFCCGNFFIFLSEHFLVATIFSDNIVLVAAIFWVVELFAFKWLSCIVLMAAIFWVAAIFLSGRNFLSGSSLFVFCCSKWISEFWCWHFFSVSNLYWQFFLFFEWQQFFIDGSFLAASFYWQLFSNLLWTHTAPQAAGITLWTLNNDARISRRDEPSLARLLWRCEGT